MAATRARTTGLYTAIAIGLTCLVAAAADNPVRYLPGVKLCDLQNTAVNESSGVAYGWRNPGIFWSHNDSGDSARVFAFNTQGQDMGTYSISGATARDWEDMCSFQIGGQQYLLISDVGDNSVVRDDYMLYLVAEPAASPAGGTLPVARSFGFTYEDGRHNCEAVAFDTTENIIYLISKEGPPCKVYALPLPASSGTGFVFTTVATLDSGKIPSVVVGMDISPDGRRVTVLTYGEAYEFSRAAGESWATAYSRAPRLIDVPSRAQGESICYGADGRSLYLTSEILPAPLQFVEAIRDPVAYDDEYSVASSPTGASVAVTLRADGTLPLTYAIVANPQHGSLSGTAPNLTYTSNPNYVGDDTFTFKASDGTVESNVATITVHVLSGAPVVLSIARLTPAGASTNAASVTWHVTFSEHVNNVETGDFTLVDVGGSISGESVTGVSAASGTAIDVTASTGSGEGTLRLDLLAAMATITDDEGKSLAADFTGGETYTIDRTPPVAGLGPPSVSVTMSGPVSYIVTYTGADSVSLAPGDVTLNRTGTADGTVAVSGSGASTRTVTISSITGDGTLGISLAANTASDNAGNQAAAVGSSVTFRVSSTPPPPPPNAPSALGFTAITASHLDLRWTDNSTNEDGFRLERKTGASGTYAAIATVGANLNSYSDTSVSGNTTYYYRVCAYNDGGDSAWSNEANVTTPAAPPPPAAPSSLTAAAAASSQINLSWTDNASDETGYKIERKTGAGGTWSQIATVAANATSYNDTGLSASTQYTYRVCAYNDGGGSAWSNEAAATTPAPPSPNTAPALTSPATAAPATVAAGQQVTFTVGASDPDGDPLTCTWDFGDGSPPSANSSHVYTAAGNYTATVTVDDGKGGKLTSSVVVTVTAAGQPLNNTNTDTDGDGIANSVDSDDDNDGVSDENEAADGTDPLSAASLVKVPMYLAKVKGGVRFDQQNRDSVALSGVIPNLPAFFNPKDVIIALDVGGVPCEFRLNAKGCAKTADGAFQMKLKFKRNKTTKQLEFLGGNAPFKAMRKNGAFAGAWLDEGVDPNVTVKKQASSLTVDLRGTGRIHTAAIATAYTGKAGKSGMFSGMNKVKLPK